MTLTPDCCPTSRQETRKPLAVRRFDHVIRMTNKGSALDALTRTAKLCVSLPGRWLTHLTTG